MKTVKHKQESRLVDSDVAAALDMSQQALRLLIARNRVELEALGAIVTAPRQGRRGAAYLLNEAQALALVAISKAPGAKEAQAAIVESFARPVQVKAHARRAPVPDSALVHGIRAFARQNPDALAELLAGMDSRIEALESRVA
jgi:hypothetical protein